MRKKDYQKPATKVVQVKQLHMLNASPYAVQTSGSRNQLSDGTDELGWNE